MRGSRCVIVVGLSWVLPACFSGADALGLPCEQDGDCGRTQSCIEGFCGGPPATQSTSVDPSSGGDGSSSAGPGTSDDGSSGTTGPGIRCGNGIVEADEQCDDEVATADCDADCTQPECGDGVVNAAAFEQCEPSDGADAFFAECTEWCTQPLFWDTMDDPDVSAAAWDVEFPAVGGTPALPSDTGLSWSVVSGAWQSGNYSCDPGIIDLEFADGVEITPPPPGMRAELRFRHRYVFDPDTAEEGCTASSDERDGAVIQILAGGAETPLGSGLYNGTIKESDNCAAGDKNPLETQPGFILSTPGNETPTFSASLEDWHGETIRVRFRMGFDCNNCGGDCSGVTPVTPDHYGWTITDVGIAHVPEPR